MHVHLHVHVHVHVHVHLHVHVHVHVHVHACDSRKVCIMPRSAMLDMSVVLGRGRPVMGEVSGSPAAAREENLCRRQKNVRGRPA